MADQKTYTERLRARIAADTRELHVIVPQIWNLMPRAVDPILGRRADMNPLLKELTSEEQVELDQLCQQHYRLYRRITRAQGWLREISQRARRASEPEGRHIVFWVGT
jgi:hypothetical protein